MNESRTYIAVPPGESIREQIDNRGMTQKEFAARMGMSEKHICRLISGDVQLTADVARRLEMVLGVPASFWNELERGYRETLLLVEEENAMDEDVNLLRLIPYRELAALGWIKKAKSAYDKVIELRGFFEVAKLACIGERVLPYALRKVGESEKHPYSEHAWIHKVRRESRGVEVADIDFASLRNKIDELKRIAFIESFDEVRKKLCELLASCGVVLVILPLLKGSRLHGATFVENGKTVISVSIRGKNADVFWFTLFHELGHVFCKHIGSRYMQDDNDEREADAFAENTLIPKNDYDTFISKGDFSKKSIINFADKMKIPPFIVLGRLQKQNYVRYDMFSELKKQYEF